MLSTFAKINAHLATRRDEDKAATAVEYALVIGLVSVVLVAALALFGPTLTAFVSGIDFGGQ